MSRRSSRLPVVAVLLVQTAAILVLLAGAGAICGLMWFHLWDPPTGVVQGGRWFTDETGLRAEFAGTALYVVIGVVAGLVAGVLVALLLARSELLSLVVLLVAAGIAGWVMWQVGLHRSAPDPDVLAAKAADGTRLTGHLHLSRRTPFVAFPLGAVVGYAVILLSVPKRGYRPSEVPAGRHRGASEQPPQQPFPDGAAG